MPRNKIKLRLYNNEWCKKKRRGPKGDELRQYHREYNQRWKKANPNKVKEYSEKAQEKRRQYHHKYYQENKDKLTPRKKQYYLINKVYFKQKSREHYLRNKEQILNKQKELRKEVIKAYGSKCVCCGENMIEFLALDHSNNDGQEHRKEIGNNKVYKWAKDNNYPNNLQILCHNCNLAKSFYGKCPHNDRIAS